MSEYFFTVMPGLVPGIHVFARSGVAVSKKDVDGRAKPNHDG